MDDVTFSVICRNQLSAKEPEDDSSPNEERGLKSVRVINDSIIISTRRIKFSDDSYKIVNRTN